MVGAAYGIREHAQIAYSLVCRLGRGHSSIAINMAHAVATKTLLC